MKRKALRIGLFGFGCVGQGLYEVLQKTGGIQAEIVKIAVKNPWKTRSLSSNLFVYNPEEILSDPTIDAVVELIDDPEAAYQIAREAILNGKHFISANKRMLAHHLLELETLATERNLSFLYEGAVCGSIPIIRNLEEYYDNDLLGGIQGIFNGSCNYILTLMERQHLSFEEALTQAQKAGFAESDPSLDVEGYDALYKTVILAAHGFGTYLAPDTVLRAGIQHIQKADLDFATKFGWRIKLLCNLYQIEDNHLDISVAPTFVPAKDFLYNVSDEYNAVSLEAAFSEKQFLMGKGAGGYPTGSAVLSDISACSYGYRYEMRKKQQGPSLQVFHAGSIWVYIRPSGPLSFDDGLLQEKFSLENGEVFIAKLSRFALKKYMEEWEDGGVFVSLLSPECAHFLKQNATIVSSNKEVSRCEA